MKLKPIKIADATEADLAEALSAAEAEFTEYQVLAAENKGTAEHLKSAQALSKYAGEIAEELTKRTDAAANMSAEFEQLGSIFAKPAAVEPIVEAQPAAAAAAVVEPPVVATAPAEAVAASSSPELSLQFAKSLASEIVAGIVANTSVLAVTTTEPLVASGAAAAAAAGSFPEPPARSFPSLTAAAGLSDFNAGQSLDGMAGLVKAVESTLRGMSSLQASGGNHSLAVASIHRSFPDELRMTEKNLFGTPGEVLKRATDQRRLAGGSLTAAGGWCAPSETDWALGVDTGVFGILSIPEVSAPRGGMKFSLGIDMAGAYADLTQWGWTQTEAQAIAGTPKTFVEIVCPTFDEFRLDAIGYGVRAPLLTKAAYPELIQEYLNVAASGYAHRINTAVIATIIADLTAQQAKETLTDLLSTTGSVLAGVEYIIEVEREKRRLDPNAAMEVVLPFWLRAAIRADLSMRTGVDMLAVSDAMINGWFNLRHANVQWVYDWQTLQSDVGENGYPAFVDILIYPAGTYVKATTDVITLRNIYDHASLTINMETELFFEEGMKVLRKGYGGRIVRVAINSGGKTGLATVNKDYVSTDV